MINYEKEIQGLYDKLYNLFLKHSEDTNIQFNFNEKQLSTGILYRLRTFYWHQNKIKTVINKNLAAPASDFFVETVAFYLKNVLKKHRPELTVNSERTINFNGKKLRPDISVFEGDKLHSIIECKTQLGWNRSKWREDFIEREKTIQSAYPNVDVYLAIMTSKNWRGLEDDENENKKYFVLSNLWPAEILNDEDLTSSVSNPFEIMFNKIIEKKINNREMLGG